MLTMKDLVKLSNGFKILYVEDDLSIQVEMKELFEMLFKEVLVANDGLEGLEIFRNHQDIDLIVSDIQMPNMNGLDMAKSIREEGSDTPIILITAFNDQEFFMKSIDIKIDKYMLKPIDDKQMLQTFYDVSKAIIEKKSYLKLKAEDEQRKLQEKQQDTISKITDAFVSPTVIYKGEELIYYSKPFMELFSIKDVDLSISTPATILFDNRKGCINSLGKYDENNLLNNKIYIKQKVGNKIFKVLKKNIELDSNMVEMYILIDITMEEYQKVKIESYIKSLEVMMIKTKKKELLPKKEEKNNKILTKNENDLLRKRHNHVMTSAELVLSMDSFILEGLQELDDLDNDFGDSMLSFDEGDFSKLSHVSDLIQRYADEIYIVEQFEDLYISIKSLADFLKSIDISLLDNTKYNEFFLYVNSIREDLALWRKSIFVDQQTDNIHYLDSSLFSTVFHIELLFSGEDEVESDDDDLEFF